MPNFMKGKLTARWHGILFFRKNYRQKTAPAPRLRFLSAAWGGFLGDHGGLPKSPLQSSRICGTMNLRDTEAERQGAESSTSPRPYAGEMPSHTADYCAKTILTAFPLIYKRGIG